MGYHAAECMLSADSSQFSLAEPTSNFAFELFAHVTRFFGYKVGSLLYVENVVLNTHYCNFVFNDLTLTNASTDSCTPLMFRVVGIIDLHSA